METVRSPRRGGFETRPYNRRKNIRLKHYDYAQAGYYFVTVCVKNRAPIFGEILNGVMQLNPCGRIVEQVWKDLPGHYPTVTPDSFIVMPNHFHAVFGLSVGAGLKPAPKLFEVVRALKTFSARRINELRRTPGTALWQRGYYEHVVRNEDELSKIRGYIQNNPSQWSLDRENPDAAGAAFKPIGEGLRPSPTTAGIEKIFGGTLP